MESSGSLEMQIFGYVDPMLKPCGSFGDELLKLAYRLRESGMSDDNIVALLKPVVDKKNGDIKSFIHTRLKS